MNGSMARATLTESDAQSNLAAITGLLGTALRLCRRDDAAVLQQIHDTRVIDEAHALDKTTFFDELFEFLQQLAVWPLLVGLDLEQRRHPIISWTALIGVYIMRLLMGIPSVPQMEGLVLTDAALMSLLGYAAFVEQGVTRRGLSRAKSLAPVRGAFSGEAVVDALVKVSLFALVRVFNAVIAILAQEGFFPDMVHATIDCTDFEATPKFRTLDGSPVASVRREKRPKHRNNRRAPKTYTTVWGWKIWLMWCPQSGMPIALYVDRINVDDRVWMHALVIQGKANLGGRLGSVTFDRGFLDGVDLYRVGQLVPFFIPGKAKMEIVEAARALGRRAKRCHEKGLRVTDGILATRPVVFVEGKGRHRRERHETLVALGIAELPMDTYAAEALGHRIHQKSFRPGTLGAVVVLHDPGYEQKEDEPLVILTNAALATPADVLTAYDRFVSRGSMENSANREAKQPWKLLSPLEKSESAVYLHAYFVFMMMALVSAFRARERQEQQAQGASVLPSPTGMERYRRRLRLANRDKILVRVGDYYGIFRTWELIVVLGVRVRGREHETPESVLARYRAGPPPAQRP